MLYYSGAISTTKLYIHHIAMHSHSVAEERGSIFMFCEPHFLRDKKLNLKKQEHRFPPVRIEPMHLLTNV